jgi:cysteine desulfurase/selenocysteine lyase
MDEFERLVGPRTRIVSVAHVSNALGTVNPVSEIADLAHRHDAVLFVDGAQAVPSIPVDVCKLGCDFYAFSGHKTYGPMGIGALYGRSPLLESMPPWQGGGDMIKSVTFEKTIYNDAPYRFEAGTPNVGGAIGLGAALDYMTALDLARTLPHKAALLATATAALEAIPGIRIIGTAREKTAVVSFVMEGVHPHDIGTVLDHEGVAVRTGHHCAQPLMEAFGVPATVRASFAFYNTLAEVEALERAVRKAARMFA